MQQRTIFLLSLIVSISSAQVFNSANVLRNKQFSLGINPVIYGEARNDDAGLFLHGEYGFGQLMDIGFNLGLGFNETYFGVNLEKVLVTASPIVSVSGGIHSFNDVGIDLALNFTIPLNKTVALFAGLDSDIVFAEKKEINSGSGRLESKSDMRFLSWFYIGSEVAIRNKMTLLFESEIGIADGASNLFGAGIKFYF